MKNPKVNTIEDLVVRIVNGSNANNARFTAELATAMEASAGKPLPALSVTEAHVVEAIGENADISASSIASELSLTRGGVSKILARLETKGYVRAASKDGNRKERKLSLTAQGQLAFEAHAQLHQQKAARLLGLLDKYSDDELDVLVRMLTDLVEGESL